MESSSGVARSRPAVARRHGCKKRKPIHPKDALETDPSVAGAIFSLANTAAGLPSQSIETPRSTREAV
jgi:hypothetical protein